MVESNYRLKSTDISECADYLMIGDKVDLEDFLWTLDTEYGIDQDDALNDFSVDIKDDVTVENIEEDESGRISLKFEESEKTYHIHCLDRFRMNVGTIKVKDLMEKLSRIDENEMIPWEYPLRDILRNRYLI